MDKKLTRYLATITPNARRRYNYVLRDWLNFLGDRYGNSSIEVWRKATTDDVHDFHGTLKGRGGVASRDNPRDTRAAVRTVNNAIRCLKGTGEMFLAEGMLERNVFKTKLLKLEHESSRPKRETLAIPVNKLKAVLETNDKTRPGEQIQTLMIVLLAGALRISEALDLSIAAYSVDLNGFPHLELKDTKSGDTVNHPIGKWAKPYIQKHLERRFSEGAKMLDNMFVRYLVNGRIKEDSLCMSTAQRGIKRVLNKHGLPDCSAHSFRKTHADALVAAGENVEKIRQALRHNDIRTTQGYFSQFSAPESALNKFVWL